MDRALNPLRCEVLLNPRALGHARDREVVDALPPGCVLDQADGGRGKRGPVSHHDRPASLVPLVQPGELGVQHDRLDRIQTAVGADQFVSVMGSSHAAVVAHTPDPVGEISVGSDHGAGVAERTEVLAGIETEGARPSH